MRAIKECEGDIPLAANLLNVSVDSVRRRVEKNPQLRALYYKATGKSLPPPPPGEAVTLLRNPNELPAPIAAADVGQMVAVTEKLLGGGHAKLGVPQATIDKLRNLSAMRIDAGAMLAVSLQDTHQLYYLQLLSLQARADEIKKLYLSEDIEAKDAPKIDPMARMFWQRAHTEIVEQLGKGYDRMMAGTQAMVAMMKGGKDKNARPGADQSEAGWTQQVPKSVSKAARGGKSQ